MLCKTRIGTGRLRPFNRMSTNRSSLRREMIFSAAAGVSVSQSISTSRSMMLKSCVEVSSVMTGAWQGWLVSRRILFNVLLSTGANSRKASSISWRRC